MCDDDETAWWNPDDLDPNPMGMSVYPSIVYPPREATAAQLAASGWDASRFEMREV